MQLPIMYVIHRGAIGKGSACVCISYIYKMRLYYICVYNRNLARGNVEQNRGCGLKYI